MWQCPECKRDFTRLNQRHVCGTGNAADVLWNRPQAIVEVFQAITNLVQQLGPVEMVARDRYVLFRSVRIFVDLTIMKDAVRIAIHVGRRLDHPVFIKVVDDGRQFTHVVKIDGLAQLAVIEPFLKEAYAHSLS